MSPIRNVFEVMKRTEDSITPEEETDFEARVIKAYENQYTLGYTEAVLKARELLSRGLTSGKMISRGEEAANQLCGPKIIDSAVVVGAMKLLKEREKESKGKRPQPVEN